MIKHLLFKTLLFLLINFQLISQDIKMKGVIINSKTNETIEFVNIGILNKNLGTISNSKGLFSINISKEHTNDSLTISHINYHTHKTPIKNLQNLTIYLEPKTNELSEIVISNKKKKHRKIGVKSYNPLLWLRAIASNNDIIENAQRINIPDKKVRIKYVNIYLRKGFESDSTYIRINFYKNENNAPSERIVFENIIEKRHIEPGWQKIDLTKHYIYLEQDFFVGVEFIPNFKSPIEVYIGAILTKGKGYSRTNSQGSWNKLQGGSTINVEIEY